MPDASWAGSVLSPLWLDSAIRPEPRPAVTAGCEVDLLVIGGPRTVRRTDHRGSVQPGGLGLVAHSALHHAPCPVLLTPR